MAADILCGGHQFYIYLSAGRNGGDSMVQGFWQDLYRGAAITYWLIRWPYYGYKFTICPLYVLVYHLLSGQEKSVLQSLMFYRLYKIKTDVLVHRFLLN